MQAGAQAGGLNVWRDSKADQSKKTMKQVRGKSVALGAGRGPAIITLCTFRGATENPTETNRNQNQGAPKQMH